MSNEITNVEVSEPSQLITLKPEKYVAEVFAPFKASLTRAVRDASKVTYDIATKDGMSKAKELRAMFKKIRTEAENARKERKAPILEIGKLLDTRYRALESEISPHEDKYDADIKAEEQRIEDEKQRKLAAERARIEAIENRIANIRNVPPQMADATSEAIRAEIDKWSETELNPADFEEHIEDAINAVNATLVELEKMRVRAAEREAAAARAEAERAELERLRQEAAKREQEEAARQAAEEQRQRQQREAHEAEMRAMREQMERERAALDAERAEIERQKREAAEAEERRIAEIHAAEEAEAASAARQQTMMEAHQQRRQDDAEEAERVRLQSIADQALADARNPSADVVQLFEQAPAEVVIPTTPPTLKLGQIGERLGFALSADFLRSLGFEGVREKGAVLFHESDFPRICASLVNHIHQVQERLAA